VVAVAELTTVLAEQAELVVAVMVKQLLLLLHLHLEQ
jgi:hypothetical protein